ncbi:hypothetical protein BBJ28_00015577 [Nothophytophthora sp. Chile5]|nr:hypothetical protein BBJ28_00015577 [Nothophytophthora sp. Chile5]
MAAPSVYGSYVVPHDEFILKKAVVASQSPEMLHRLQEPIRFLCLTCPFSLTAGSNHIELVTTTHEQLFSAEDASRVFIATHTRRLRTQHHIRLIICTESIEDSVIAACTRQGIACVQFAESADVETLCITAGIFSLASLFDDIQAAQHVGVCLNGVSSVRFQQQACLRLRGLAKSDIQTELRSPDHQPFVVIPQLLVHAPTKGVYKQYYAAISKALRVLRSWWELSESPAITIDGSPRPRQNSEVVYCCRGGGSAELAIARWLQDGGGEGNSKLRAADAAVASLARQILANALLEVVAVLRTNLSNTCSNDNEEGINPRQCSQRRVLLEVFSNQSSGNQPQEIRGYVLDFTNVLHTMAGPIDVPELVLADPKAYGLVHPWKRLETLVFLVAQTLEQLLRIDAVLRTADTPETGD